MANIFEFLSKDGNITPEKARKSRKMQFHDKTAYVWMEILPLKKRVNRYKCSFPTKQRMFRVFAIDEPRSKVRALYATLIHTYFTTLTGNFSEVLNYLFKGVIELTGLKKSKSVAEN